MARQSLDNSLDADIRDIDHYKKKRVLSRFEDEEAFFDKTQNDTTTEARNVKGIASSRMPFSEYRQ
jgi:CRISPR/Cas system Type II protein with McrA/HNH and RuvC-like nuclease domain